MNRAPKARRDAPARNPRPEDTSELRPLFAGMGRTLQRTLEKLDRDSPRIARAFRRRVRRLAPRRAEYRRLAALDPLECYRSLTQGGPAMAEGHAAYRLAVESVAQSLLRAGVAEDRAMVALGLHLEASLASLDQLAEARALVRLTSVTQFLMAAAYGEDRMVALRRLDERERQRLSGDLHDEVGADLVVLKLYVEMIAADLAKGGRSLGPKLEEALALIGHAIESVRRLTLDLGPAFLDTLGFLPALRSFVRQFSQRTGIQVRLDEPEALVSLPASHEAALYRVVLGALSNVAKHSKARHAAVILRSAGNSISMSVEDDGRGFDPRALDHDTSFGLTTMGERIRGLRGRLSIRSRARRRGGKGAGTRIEVRLPLRKVAGP